MVRLESGQILNSVKRAGNHFRMIENHILVRGFNYSLRNGAPLAVGIVYAMQGGAFLYNQFRMKESKIQE